MIRKEDNYDFKKELLVVHKPFVRMNDLKPLKGELEIADGITIVVGVDSEVVYTAVRDFEEYLYLSMNIAAVVSKKELDSEQKIIIKFGKNLGKADGYMGYRITTTANEITIEGYDERGIAQGLYYLEDVMNIRKAPYVKLGIIERKAMFSPRITQSPFGINSYPDEAFKIIAHNGMDAIELWIKDECTDKRGDYIDIKLICEKAKKYGIDVYIELYAPHTKHPDDPDAEEFYDQLYGNIFRLCPDIKGLTLLGEATNFNSKDPNVGKAPHSQNFIDNIPTGKTSPGWYPCCDYPQWVNIIKNVVRKYNPNVEIMLSTYNWGYQPEGARLKLIDELPTDVTLLVAFEMFQTYPVGKATGKICDYTLKATDAGQYFISEAKRCKERGIKLAAEANTSGRTWDFGVIPYEPMPEQWIKRFKSILKLKEEYNLCGLLENIHYGFHPSMISELEKQAFFTEIQPIEKTLMQILERDYGKENLSVMKRVTELLSKAIRHFTPSNEDQYGAFRIGPAYPLWSGALNGLPSSIPNQGKQPSRKKAMFGNCVYFGEYTSDMDNKSSLSGVRIYEEIKELEKMLDYINRAIELLDKIMQKNERLEKFILLVKFIRNTVVTGINTKKHYIIKQKLLVAKTSENADKLIKEMEEILNAEKRNVLDTIPIVQADSRLGWEASMEYTTDVKGLEWKLRQLDCELNFRLADYKKSNKL